MTGRRLVSVTAVVIALAVMAVLWGMKLETERRLREQTESSGHLLARLNQLEVENLRLSNFVAQADTPLAEAQLAELTKLREEVESLKKRTNDLQRLQTELHRLRAELTNARMAMSSNGLPNVPAKDIYPRESWTLAGYDTPESALESATWAISAGDEDAYMASLSPDLQDAMEAELTDGSFADEGPMELSNATGFRIVDRDSVSEKEIIITIYIDGDGNEVPLRLVKTPDGWRVAGDASD